jgi:glycosyltransferase involved in cell wall biosynthesis
MNIGIDLIPLKTYSVCRGIGKYSHDLVKELVKIDQQNQYFLFNVPDDHFQRFESQNVIVSGKEVSGSDTDNLDIFIFTSFFEWDYPISPHPSEIMCKKAVVVYDLIPILFWDHYISQLPDEMVKIYFDRLALLQHFDIIFTISNATKIDLIELLDIPSEKIVVIYSGLNEEYDKRKRNDEEIERIKEHYGIKRKYLLSTPGYDFRKNIFGIFEAFSLLPPHLIECLDLVLVCNLKPHQKRVLLNIWSELKLPVDHLILTNYIPVDDLISLYDGAELFVFPSFYEGFGIPVLESMSRGCPVVTSAVSSLPEVCESAAILTDPYVAQQTSSAIEEILNNSYVRNKLITLGYEQSKKFSWTRVIQRVLETFNNIKEGFSEKKLTQYTPPPKRIAFFTTLNPVKSGISDYSEELLKNLKKRYVIDIFIDTNYTPTNPDIVRSFDIYQHTFFESKKDQYDLVMYQVGNSKYHSYMYEYLIKYPGIVVLHDAILSYFFEALCIDEERHTLDYKKYLDCVFVNHGYNRYLQSLNIYKKKKSIDYYDLSLNFLKKIIDSNYLTIVHSEFSKRIIDTNVSFSNIHKINLGFSTSHHEMDKDEIKSNFNLSNVVIISAFGRITRTKRIDVLLSSLAKIIREYDVKNVLLFLVGSVESDMKTEIKRLIRQNHLNEHVRITGYIPNDEFNRYYAITDICVNLRYPSSGETSVTLVNALANGLPVITSNIEQYREYPDDCVWKVDIDSDEVEELTAFLLELIRNKELRKTMSENSLNYGRENHSPEQMLSAYISDIDSIIESRGR